MSWELGKLSIESINRYAAHAGQKYYLFVWILEQKKCVCPLELQAVRDENYLLN
jgi:hypothetical protein